MFTPVLVHASWMALTTAVGLWPGYTGLLRALCRADGRSLLPGRFNLKMHKWGGIIFYAMLYLGLAGWVTYVNLFFGGKELPAFWLWHVRMAVAIAILYAPAAWLGFDMLRKPPGLSRGRPVVHMVLNFAGCTLLGVQLILAILKLRGVL